MPMKPKQLLSFLKMSTNSDIANIFIQIADSLNILGENVFKIRAYQKASKNISELPKDVKNYSGKDELQKIPGIGNDLADKIIEFIDTGEIKYFEDLKEKIPLSLLELLRIQGVGPKFLSVLFNEFDVKDITGFEKALDDESLLEVKGIGKKKIDEIKKGIDIFKTSIDRTGINKAYEIASSIVKEVENIKGTKNTQIAGSLRRWRETVGDIDIITSAEDTKPVVKAFTNFEIAKEVLASGDTKGSIIVEDGIQVDLRVVKPGEYGAAIQYFSGSKLHNVRVRTIASKLGYKINEYGLYEGDKKIEGKSEEKIYGKLGLDFVPPELREDRGEIEAAQESKLPKLIQQKDIKGDLHTHSTWSDGKSTIEEMALAAKKLSYEYIAITDHSISSRIANGLNEKRLFEKKKELEKIDKKIDGIKIFMGSEVDIKSDGTLDYSNDVLKELDFVVASVHSGFKMETHEITERIINAVKNPYVHAIGHPTGRLIGEREPYNVDIDKLIEAAKKYGKALEINSSPKRLDLKDLHARKAIQKGVKIIISTDSHRTEHLSFMKFGVGTARRGWTQKSDVINTYSLKKLIKWLDGFK